MHVALIQIRDVSDSQLRELKARAAAEGQSLNSFMRELIRRETATPTVAEVLSRAADRSERASLSALEVLDGARSERGSEISNPLEPDPSRA